MYFTKSINLESNNDVEQIVHSKRISDGFTHLNTQDCKMFQDHKFSIFFIVIFAKYKLVRFVHTSTFSIFCETRKITKSFSIFCSLQIQPASSFAGFPDFWVLKFYELRNKFFNLVRLFSPFVSVTLMNFENNILKN